MVTPASQRQRNESSAPVMGCVAQLENIIISQMRKARLAEMKKERLELDKMNPDTGVRMASLQDNLLELSQMKEKGQEALLVNTTERAVLYRK